MEYLIRFVQIHETFRKPELEALAKIARIDADFVVYAENSPYSIVRLENDAAAQALIVRSISSKGIYELWGVASDYEGLHRNVVLRTSSQWQKYQSCSFRFEFEAFQGSRTLSAQKDIIASFNYFGFEGPIKMRDAEQIFTIFEEYDHGNDVPKQIYLARFIASSDRRVLSKYSLKTREYINTTSMDSELALLTANITLAGPHKIFYDPFVGTGSFPVACSHFGARTLGSDIDGRMVRGKNGKDIRTNFRQYNMIDRYLDGFISDLTHSPLRVGRWLDGIICDPPYGVREGLKVLGAKNGKGKEAVFIDGKASHFLEAMLKDILHFAAQFLVDEGRLSLWMPTANDEDVELGIPSHPALELVAICIQVFNKWSRRLLTYRRVPGIEAEERNATSARVATGASANELNAFRKRYFQGFKAADEHD